MLENVIAARAPRNRTLASMVVSLSVALHVLVGVAVILRGYWVIEKLPLPDQAVVYAITPQPPPPAPPPPPARASEPRPEIRARAVRVESLVQPVVSPIEVEVIEPGEPDGAAGVEGGVAGGVAGGVVGGVIGGVVGGVPGGIAGGVPGGALPPPPPLPAPVVEPRVVPPTAVEQHRIAGTTAIQPDDATRQQIARDALRQVVSAMMICLSARGSVDRVELVKSSGYAAYDRKIAEVVRGWRYRPFQVDGQPVPVCTSVTFVYRQG